MKTKIFSLLKSKLTKTDPYLPEKLYPNDLFLVSYPKSGNTWVRFLLANLIKHDAEEIVDFNTVQRIIPEVGRNNQEIEKLSSPRIIKSHAPHYTKYPKVIYVVRDGRDAYVSYYFYRLKRLAENTTFGEFLSRTDHYPCLWSQHVESWLFGKKHSSQLLIVHYEDLITNCFEQLQKIVNFAGLEASTNQMETAIEASSFNNMRRLEVERGRPYKQQEGSAELFVRKGQVGNWQDFFGPEEKALFKAREGETLMRLGYEASSDW